jgi:hypothetical protein
MKFLVRVTVVAAVVSAVISAVAAVETITELRQQRRYLRHSNNAAATSASGASASGASPTSHPSYLYDDMNRFEQWVTTYEIQMPGPEAYLNLLDKWVSNDRYIAMVNSMELSYRLGHNYFSGMNIVDYANWYIEKVSKDGFIRDRSRANISFVRLGRGDGHGEAHYVANRYRQYIDSHRCEFGGVGCDKYQVENDNLLDIEREADTALDQRDYQFFEHGSMVGFDKRVFRVGTE